MNTLYAFGSRWAVRLVATAIGVLFCLAPALADQFYYSRMRGNGTTETGLFRWDDATGAQSQVGGDGVYLREATDGNLVIVGLAATSTGTLYGFAVDDANTAGFLPTLDCGATNRSRLVTIDTSTATVAYVGPWLAGRSIVGAGFNGQDQLWAYDCQYNAVLQIDPATGTPLGSSISMHPNGPIGFHADIEFVGSGWGIVGSFGAQPFRAFNPTTGGIALVTTTAQNQGFDSYGIDGLAFTSHLDARNGGAAAIECRLNILDFDNADELGHINDRFNTNPAAAFKDANQYTPPSLPFNATVGDMTRANGPVLPNCVYDWGEAGAGFGFPTLPANNGARHRIVLNGPFLGAALPDFEVEVREIPLGGDNAIGPDTDGVVIPNNFPRGTTVQIQVTAGNVGPDTRLQGWIDWGLDGSLAEPGDQILTDVAVTPGVNTFDLDVSATLGSGATRARFRIANQTGLGPAGLAETGEVEDYPVIFTGPADASITVTDNSAVYRPGTNASYTIVVSNAGPFAVNDVRVTNPRPSGITTVSWTCVGVNGGVCTRASGTGPIGSFPNPQSAGDVPPGGSLVFTSVVTVPAGFTGNLVNTATVSTTGTGATDPDTTNNSATDTDVPARADVAITMTSPAAVPPGGNLAYTLTVTNHGPDAATAVSVDDPTPAGLTFLSNAGACATAFPCALGDLAAGATRTITATYRVPTNYTTPDPIVNTATVTNTTVDLVTTNNSASASTLLGPPQSDLQMVKSVSPDAVTPGQTFTYTLQVKNNGPSDATNITVTDTLPAQTTFVSSVAGCTAVDQVVTCPAIPSMIAGASATFDLVVQLNPSYSGNGADILNSATVASDTTDPALGNNSNPAGAPPVGPAGADLTLVKTVSGDVVVPGQTLTYNLLVSNQGPSTAADVVVIDPLPAAMTFVSSPEGCTAAGQLVTCPAIATLPPGDFATFTLVVRLDPGYTGDGTDLDNRATVQSPTKDPGPGNNTTPPVRPNLGVATADLTSEKMAIGNAISPGIVFTYRISVTNAGPSSAADVTVTDPLPSPLTFVSSPSGCTADVQIVTCSRASVPPGTTATFDLLVRLDPAYTGDGSDLVNTASVASTTPDATPDNNQPAPAPPPPIRVGEADVTITKTGPYGVAPAGGEISYTIVVTNQGPNDAMDVVVSDPTPSGLTLLGTAGACTTPFPCALGTLTAGQIQAITARYAADPSVTGVISNTATVSSTTPDPSAANGTATAQTPPPPITYYLAEGATGTFWEEDLVMANPNGAPAPVTLRFLKEDGAVITQTLTVAAASRATVRVNEVAGLEAAAASAEIVSEDGLPLAIERTMSWDAGGYGAHSATAVTQAATRWYFAEGAQGLLHTFVLLENPQSAPADVAVTFLRELDTPVVRSLTLAPRSRATLEAIDIPELQGRPFGIVVDATQPIVAERSMYLQTSPHQVWNGGHASVGVTEPAQRWFYAEGATGSFFDTFILLSNPQTVDAHVTMAYILPDGTTITVPKLVPAQGRLTVNIDAEDDPRLHAAAVSTRIVSDVPVVTERSMYWNTKPDAFAWSEGHNTFGVDQTAARWGLADGRVGGPRHAHSYILLSNPWPTAAEVQVTYLRENGAAPVVKTYTVAPTTRYTIDVNVEVPELQDEGFGARIEVTNGLTIGVERSVYWDANGVFWSAGTNAVATRLP